MKVIKKMKQIDTRGNLQTFDIGADAAAVIFSDGVSLAQKAAGWSGGGTGALLSGTVAPASSLGEDGDIYIQY